MVGELLVIPAHADHRDTLEQTLEIDNDDDIEREFSRAMVMDSFVKMEYFMEQSSKSM